ncbi:Cytochrome P450 3A21 [Araneus ventricosus]|uniref:Cytochrome P450 3A21 n=1 Tax=Araneus ventricosus TaxID=182803 RepID=A0A4Y2KTK1_ARAVE|nr:Cytochrome P450 3A21 [Araneus ventricosus]
MTPLWILLSLSSRPSHEVDLERYLKLGPVYGQYDGNTPVLAVADPKLLREILVKEFPTFMNRRMAEFMSGDAMVSSFLFTLRGEEWRRMRNIISPTFSTGKIKKMISYIKQCSSTMIENLKKASRKGKPLQVKQFSNAFSMDVIASAAFSVHLDSYNDPKNTFIQSALKAFSPNINIKLAFYQLWPKLAKRVGVQVIYTKPLYFFKESALHIMKQRKKTGHTRNDFLQFLMGAVKDFAEEKEGDVGKDEKDTKSYEGQDKNNNQIDKSLSLDEAVSHCVQFFIAGFDTVSSAIANAVYLLALHPDIQNRTYEEMRDVLQKTEGDLTYEALQEMNYLDNVISETLRLYPSFSSDILTFWVKLNIGCLLNIAKLISFLTENENIIKQPPDATSSYDSDPDFSPSPRPQTYGLRPSRGSIPRTLISPLTSIIDAANFWDLS